jgi:RNA polymerase sigma-70 factor (ECF subfamily)
MITTYFAWPRYRTSKIIQRLLAKKIIVKKYYGVVVLNTHWEDWIDGKVANLINKVPSDNFDENISENLYHDLVNFAKSKGLQVDDAEDAVMTSLLKAKEKYKQFKQGTNFRGWVFTIVSNTILDSRKKKKENQLFENELEEIVDTKKSVFDTLEMKSQMVKFKEKFSLLHPYYQNLLTLYANEVPYKDVSILLDTPEGTVKSKIHRAKIKFMELINDH